MQKLFESPDGINGLRWNSSDSRCFGVYDGKLLISDKPVSHEDLKFEENLKDIRKNGLTFNRHTFEYAGRLWLSGKVISFWEYPDRDMLKKLISEIEQYFDINIWDNPEWKIEIIVDKYNNIQKGYKDEVKVIHKLIPIKSYLASKNQSEEDFNKEHTTSPMNKSEKEVTTGFGSKHPKSEERFKTKMQAPFESYYPRLNESPDNCALPPNAKCAEDGEQELSFRNSEALSFGYYKNKFYISDPGGKHYEIETKQGHQTRIDYKFAGRIWTNHKILSFWDYPSKTEFQQFARDLKKHTTSPGTPGIDILNDPDYLVEIVRNDEDEKILDGQAWYSNETHTDLISPKDYMGSDERSKEEIEKQHVISPLLKKQKEVPTGFGSKHPKAEERFKTKIQAPFENVEEKHYPRLFENPNAIYDTETGKTAMYNKDAMPFWYMGDIMHVGGIGSTHDTRLNYAGRLFFTQKIITFWHFPENKAVLNKVLSDIEKRLNKTGKRDINFKRDGWKIEIPADDIFQKMKNGDSSNDKNWGNWSPSVTEQKFIDIDDYNGEYERSTDELKQDHVISPLLKKYKIVPIGVGSKHINVEQKFKEKMQAPFESYYPRLNESPDIINVDGKFYQYNEKITIPFSVTVNDNKIVDVKVGACAKSHGDAKIQYNSRINFYQQYHGRLYTTPKVITFWKYPEKSDMVIIIRMIENKIKKKIFGNNWRLEFYNFDIENENNSTFVSIDEYLKNDMKSEDVSDKEYQEHLKSPLLKKQKTVPIGFGSKHPEAEQKFKEKMNAPFESYYPHLNESPDEISAGKYKGMDWYMSANNAFGYVKGKFVITPNEGKHLDMEPGSRRSIGYPGRIWPELKIISFWTYPPNKKEFKKVIDDLIEATNINIWNDPAWKVEIIKNKKTGKEIDGLENFEEGLTYGAWAESWKAKSSIVNVKNYTGSEDQSEEAQNKEHVISPLLKNQKEVPAGFGSKHPKAEERAKQKRDNPFENKEEDFYPTLHESDLKDAYLERKFGIKREEHEIPVFKKDIVAIVKDDMLKEIPIFKNPKNLNDYDKDVRAIADENGNLYVAFQNRLFNHGAMGNALMDAEEIKTKKYNELARTSSSASGVYDDQKHFLLLERMGSSNTFIGSDVFEWVGGETERMIKKLKTKNPQFKYKLPEFEEDYDEIDESLTFYPRLNESPDEVWTPAAKLAGDNLSYNNSDAYAFKYSYGEFFIGKARGTHSDLRWNQPSDDGHGIHDNEYYEGRIWTKHKVISFWTYPPIEIFKIIIKSLEDRLSIKIFADPKWLVEVVKQNGEICTDTYDKTGNDIWNTIDDDGFGVTELEYYTVEFIHPKDYIGSKDHSERVQHELSPLLKKSKEVPAGFGSKHPEAEHQFKKKMGAPFESSEEDEYPRLFEARLKKNYDIQKSEQHLTPDILTQELQNLLNNKEFLQWAGVITMNDPNYTPSKEELIDGYCELIVGYIFLKYPAAKEDGFSYEHIYFTKPHNYYQENPHTYITYNNMYYDGYNVNGVDKIWKLKFMEKFVTDEAKAGKYDNQNGFISSDIFILPAHFQHIGGRYDKYTLPPVIKRSVRMHIPKVCGIDMW